MSCLTFRPLALALALAFVACPAEAPGPTEPESDASQGSDAASDLPVLGKNAPPGPLEMHLAPTTPTTIDDLVVVVDTDSIDPDGQPEALSYSVRWFKDDALTLSSGRILPASQTRRGETWRVEVGGFDGLEEGPTQSATVSIGNSPPSLTHVSLKPSQPTVDDVLTCAPGVLSDPDDDDVSLTYRWFKSDQPISGATTAGLQPPLEAGAAYQCAATPFDGQVDGEVRGSNIATAVIATSNESLIVTSPSSLDLGTVLPGEVSEESLTISNIGDGPLLITSGTLEGQAGFIFDDSVFPASVLPGGEMVVTVGFATAAPGLKKGTLVIASDAKNRPVKDVPLLGIGASPCLALSPPTLDFGGTYAPTQVDLPLTLKSCGDLPVTVESIALVNPSSAPFALNLAPLPESTPFSLEPGEEVFLNVTFNPVSASDVDADGLPIAETATVSIASNAPTVIKEAVVSGFAAPGGCPVALPAVVEGAVVVPNATVQLSANASFGAFGVPSIVSWSVSSVPNGETAQPIEPSADLHDVAYTVGGSGVYQFELKVFDETNADGLACGDAGNPCTNVVPGCVSGFATVEVKDATPLVIELLWDTPGDANQNDTGAGKGADLDLHVHNGSGAGDDYDEDGVPDSWFDIAADCFWLDSSPNWGAPGAQDDPWLSLEDADGAGPERIEYANPVPGEIYTLGAHYWSDFEYGSSVLTMRAYHFGELVWEVTDVVVESGDMYEAATLAWPGALVTPSFDGQGGPKITGAYPNPFFQ